ncbi:MAG: ABC transporter ATP-binding protein [Alphaproteobacteria bacterium]
MTDILKVEDVTVRFGGVTAVSGASLTVQKGNLIGFIGPNGAGKTTLMRIITGIVQPQQGRILLEGRDISNWSVSRRVRAGLALAQQIVHPLRDMTLLDNVTLAAGMQRTARPLQALFHTNKSSERATARELLVRVGIADAADAEPSTLPLGYLKRLEVARALALKPKLLLLDEPLAGLNQQEARAMADLIADLSHQGQTILLIEHNLREVMRICPTLYVQDNGKPLAFGETHMVMANPAVRLAYLGGSA